MRRYKKRRRRDTHYGDDDPVFPEQERYKDWYERQRIIKACKWAMVIIGIFLLIAIGIVGLYYS